MEYLVEEERRRNAVQESSAVTKIIGNFSKVVAESANNAIKFFVDLLRRMYKFCRKTFYRFAAIDVQENDEEPDEDQIENLDEKLNELERALHPIATVAETDDISRGPIVIIGDNEPAVDDNNVFAFDDNIANP